MNVKIFFISMLALLSMVALAACGNSSEEEITSKDSDKESGETQGEINLYTGRHYETDQKLYDTFTEETGIKVNVIKGKDDELMARLEREGKASEADLFITADAGRLHLAKEKGLLQEINSETVNENVPAKYRDEDNKWVGLTKRARVIVYHKDRVNPEDVQTYDDLTNEALKGKVLIRSSSNIYNQSLVASLIAINGEDAASEWASGIVDNMARDPKGGDTDQAIAVAAGEGDVAVINTYYYGRMLNSDDEAEVKAAEQLGIIFPNQETTGTHVNISGVGLTASSKNKENAIKFIEYLTSEDAQGQFASANYEYPVNPDVEPAELLKSWGEFKEQEINLTKLGENNNTAIKIMNKVGWK